MDVERGIKRIKIAVCEFYKQNLVCNYWVYKRQEDFVRRGDISYMFANFVNCIVNGIQVVTIEREYVVLPPFSIDSPTLH